MDNTEQLTQAVRDGVQALALNVCFAMEQKYGELFKTLYVPTNFKMTDLLAIIDYFADAFRQSQRVDYTPYEVLTKLGTVSIFGYHYHVKALSDYLDNPKRQLDDWKDLFESSDVTDEPSLILKDVALGNLKAIENWQNFQNTDPYDILGLFVNNLENDYSRD